MLPLGHSPRTRDTRIPCQLASSPYPGHPGPGRVHSSPGTFVGSGQAGMPAHMCTSSLQVHKVLEWAAGEQTGQASIFPLSWCCLPPGAVSVTGGLPPPLQSHAPEVTVVTIWGVIFTPFSVGSYAYRNINTYRRGFLSLYLSLFYKSGIPIYNICHAHTPFTSRSNSFFLLAL